MSLLDRLLQGLPRSGAAELDRQDSGQADRFGPAGTLERLIATLEVAVSAFAICEVARGHALALGTLPRPTIHYVLKGSGILRLEDDGEVRFTPHTFIIVPAGRAHSLETQDAREQIGGRDRPVAMVDHMLRIASDESEDPEVITTCGTIEASYRGSIGLFDFVDRPIALLLQESDPLRRSFEVLLEELASPRLGSRALTEALLKECLVHLIRKIAPDPLESGWLFGAVDPRLARAVLAMVDNPAESFTLDGLAKSAGMSRSSFMARFHAAFGTTPIDLLKRIRLRHAARLLARTDLPIAVIARSIGYESRTYFSRAFRAEFGADPRSFRAHSRAPDRIARGQSQLSE
jgi:AraC-like DNA-binding protein/quercetin dioxygenase-like cupin family protein